MAEERDLGFGVLKGVDVEGLVREAARRLSRVPKNSTRS